MGRARIPDQPAGSAVAGHSGTPGGSAALSLPKGGGAIRSIGEKFAANPVTGTGSLTIPIATSPGRSNFGPKLALAYDSGAGNGTFGLGWTLSLPSITRKTAQGLPCYRDAEESDDFILSDAEDLVPILAADGTRHSDTASMPGFTIRRYRPRIDTLYSRIERWTRTSDGDTHWRSISSDNILTIYGGDVESRIADPTDPARIFSWRICETRDDRGNAIVYRYKPDDVTGVEFAKPSERNRGHAADPRRKVNRYIKRILYGNRQPLLTAAGVRPAFLDDLPASQLSGTEWMFEAVFDYGDHDSAAPTSGEQTVWPLRFDPFAAHRAGFEVRTTRLCRRVLMFHHIPDDPAGDVGYDGVVRSTEFAYLHDSQPPDPALPVYAMLVGVTQAGWRRQPGGDYLRRSLPPIEFEYTLPQVEAAVREVDPESAENLPVGIDGARYRWVDLHGEGIAGAFSEQGQAWYYKRNLSPLTPGTATLAPLECLQDRPNLSVAGGAQFLDLAGDGQPDLVLLRGTQGGFHEHDDAEGWTNFKAFDGQLSGSFPDPNSRFVDLTGDGTADLLITKDDQLVWREALGEAGFADVRRVAMPLSDEDGPRVDFADSEETIQLADFSGDGLQDIVRIRNGEVCYWPNLGYGRFGTKISMDNSPRFDRSDQFAPDRVVLADIDGSGTTDLIYLHGKGVRLYFNLSGNGWSAAQDLPVALPVDNATNVAVADLLGNGTACLVWSSPLAAATRRPIRFVSLMGDAKPHLLVKTVNNLGAETHVRYAPSTKFYLADKRAGAPWLTRLPFPVHVVEQVETHDRVARSRFVTRYAYHHGFFDGVEREFRGFAMVEQWDGEEFADSSGTAPAANVDAASFVPPVHTKSWFHVGAWLGQDARSDFFAGLLSTAHRDEYYREPGLSDAQARQLLLEDSVLPTGLTIAEEREAARALKGAMLRQEIYADDASAKALHPYTVTEQNLRVVMAQGRGANRAAVFATQANEAITFHYERNQADPRVQHVLTLEVDAFGNVRKQAAVNYARRQPDPALPLAADRAKQSAPAVLYSEHGFTNAIDGASNRLNPQPCEERSYELTGYAPSGSGGLFRPADFVTAGGGAPVLLFDSEIGYGTQATSGRQRRLIEHGRTLFRRDDLGALLPLGQIEPRGLAGETYKLAYSAALIAQLFARDGAPLLADFAPVLGGSGYLRSQALKADGRFPATDADNLWWIPSGRSFLSPGANDTPAVELAYAGQHYFLPMRTRDPFHTSAASTESLVLYDGHDLLKIEAQDAVGNRSTVGERLANGTRDPAQTGNDYRVLQPACLSDANRNRTQVAFDALGLVVGAATLGKPEESFGDSLVGFASDLSDAEIASHIADPLSAPETLLKRASTRMVYDLFAYHRTRTQANPDPVAVHSMMRETHESDLLPGATSPMQHSVSYSDGFGREIQRKLRVEPGSVIAGGPIVSPRWVASGWVINNNKGKPVRQYEPFFSAGHGFEFASLVGVSPVLFYDPVGRVVATLHPNATYEKSVFDGWQQAVWDVNDTVLLDPRTDPDVVTYTAAYFADPAQVGWQTWRAQRQGGGLGSIEQASAAKAAAHAGTPTAIHLDALGRPFLTIVDNGPDPAAPGAKLLHASRSELDIEGNERTVRDAIVQNGDAAGRVVARYAYDMLGTRVRQTSMDAGTRWLLNDAGGHALRVWDERSHAFVTDYDVLRRPLRTIVQGSDPANPAATIVADRFVYGDQHPQAEALNLRGSLYLHLDQAGSATSDARDFKGNVLRATRRLTAGLRYRASLDWAAVDANSAALPPLVTTPFDTAALAAALVPVLEADGYASINSYDALNRVTGAISPHTPVMAPSTVRFGFNEANLLERVDVRLRGASAAGQPVWTNFVANIDYDAKGQRQRIDYGNGVATIYEHDPLTFRLVRMVTRRDALQFPGDAPQPAQPGWPGAGVQDLSYSYDPVGNIAHVGDAAQQAVYFANRRVDPASDYVYDALYRLVEASGREHLGQGGEPTPYTHDDAQRMRLPQPGDGAAMGTYRERYSYDPVGNFLEMRHRGTAPAHPGWTRTYGYAEPSLIENGAGGAPLKTGNRLSGTATGGGAIADAYAYAYDGHGNMVRMPHLGGVAENMHWDESDRLRRVDLGGGGTAYNVYDARGQRIRKVWEKSATLVEERIYLGGFEIFRRRQGANLLERETLHVMDDTRRIAVVETRTADSAGTDTAPAQMIRYQFGNHLGSASLELDAAAQIVSYEEFTPFGSTSYHAVRSQTETPKRYRFTGKERDEESGFYYHGARYYAPWLGRWVSCDPIGLSGGDNLLGYAECNPVILTDPSGHAPKKYEDQRGKDTAAKKAEMDKNLGEAKKKGFTPDPMQEKAADYAKRTGKANPIQQHHHKGVKQSAKVKLPPSKMGTPMSSVYSTKRDPGITAAIDGKPATHHNVAKHLDMAEQAKVPKTAAGLEEAAKISKERLPATVDMTERAKMDWKKSVPKGPPVDSAGKVIKVAEEGAEVALKQAPKATKLAKVGTSLAKASRHGASAIPFVGIGANIAAAGYNWSQGNYGSAFLDAFGAVPIVGDVVDAARGGVALGDAVSEAPAIEKAAMRTGAGFEDAAKYVGFGADTSRAIGAGGAAIGAVGEFVSWTNPITGPIRLIGSLLD